MSTSVPVTISIVVATFNREEELRSLIAQLAQQPTAPHELVVIDQRKTGAEIEQTLEPLRQRAVRCSCLYSMYASAGSNRNVGVAASSGDVVLFLDDDIELLNDIVEAHAGWYSEEPGITGVAGHVVPKHAYSEEYVRLNTWCPGGDYVTNVRSGNLSLRRGAFLEAGGFSAFFAGANEEVDLARRVIGRGGKIRNGTNAVVAHLTAPGGYRTWGDAESRLQTIRNSVAYATVRFGLFGGLVWPVWHWRRVLEASGIVGSRQKAARAVASRVVQGIRLGICSQNTRDFVPISIRLARGDGLDVRTGLPITRALWWRRTSSPVDHAVVVGSRGSDWTTPGGNPGDSA